MMWGGLIRKSNVGRTWLFRSTRVTALPEPVTIVAHEVGTPGGMERQLGVLVSGLLERGYEVTVVAHECALGPRPGLRWLRVSGPRRPFTLWYPWFFLIGSLAVWRGRRGLLHTTGALVANRADLSTVHFCHRAFHAREGALRSARETRAYRANAWLADRQRRLAETWCFRPRRSGRLVAVSRGVERELREFFPAMAARVQTIPNGVDRSAFRPDPAARARVRAELGIGADELVAVFVGGEWERKGLRPAVEALPGAEGWSLLVVGGGDERGFRELAARLRAGDRVRFAGAVSDTTPYYAAADAFLLPTAYETFSLATYEAAASGLPLLVGRVSGVEDLLVEGRNGWFVERDAGGIAGRLAELAGDPERRRSMGAAAREDSARFDWQSVVDSYDELYRSLR
jgi:glycosyltransferase involved in cell wall biosynthesis